MWHRDDLSAESSAFHHLPWADFDGLARADVDSGAVRLLRRAERSRRLLLLRALVDEVTKTPELFGPLPSPEEAWDLLARVEARSPAAFDLVLAHPYTGSWAGYTIRLLRDRITGVCPLWMHVGHLHAIAAAAAIHAGLNFRAAVPLWNGGAILPTLGLARLPADEPHSVAEVRGDCGRVEIAHGITRIELTDSLATDTPGWWSVRRVTTAGRHPLTIRLDDVDPYRGLHEPVSPRRLPVGEVGAWRGLLDDAWQLLTHHVPDLADAFPAGLDSIVPGPAMPFRDGSASTGEAFGSALVARPADGASLAATLVHEFHHILLGGVLHLTRLYHDDPSERYYVPWRDDPRPLSGALQGVYAFFGVTAFWRAVARVNGGSLGHRAMFEFALWRGHTARVLDALREDASLTGAGRRFVGGIADRLDSWQEQRVPEGVQKLADAIATDHHAGWRLRHLRPSRNTVTALTEAWLAGRSRPPAMSPAPDPMPTPVPDGTPSCARTDLTRLRVTTGDTAVLRDVWSSVPDATTADLAYATGQFAEAAAGYRAALRANPDHATSWVGLGMALTELGTSAAARALTHRPELVRAVRRQISTRSPDVPTPEGLATWLGQSMH
jgi:HEXXH motif-containing protein